MVKINHVRLPRSTNEEPLAEDEAKRRRKIIEAKRKKAPVTLPSVKSFNQD